MKRKIDIYQKLIEFGYGDIRNQPLDIELQSNVIKWIKDTFNIDVYINKTNGCEYMKGFSYSIITPNSCSQRYGFRLREHAFKRAIGECSKKFYKKVLVY